VTAKSILRIVERPGRIVSGEILLRKADGSTVDLVKLPQDGPDIRAIRGGEIGLVFQEPMSSLSAFHTIGNQLVEAIRLHSDLSKKAARTRAIDLLNMVGIPRPSQRIDAYSFELSGGLRQRVMIALALAAEPRILIADEPTTALDVTVQAQILDLLKELTRETGSSLILITHDLGIVARYADSVSVMYGGRMVEKGRARDIYERPAHPYTIGLMASVPRLDSIAKSRLTAIEGQPPNLVALPPGCAFAPRCGSATAHCATAPPPLVGIGEGHEAACYHHAA
jgi:oligopeptide/dipeptide ABC transporter ATP-binding protein